MEARIYISRRDARMLKDLLTEAVKTQKKILARLNRMKVIRAPVTVEEKEKKQLGLGWW